MAQQYPPDLGDDDDDFEDDDFGDVDEHAADPDASHG